MSMPVMGDERAMAACNIASDTLRNEDPKDTSNWYEKLESVLMYSNNINDIVLATKGKEVPEALRSHVWQVCLEVKDTKDIVLFEEIFDLPEQNVLRKDCYNLVDKLGNDDEDKLSIVSDLESILTYFCKTKNMKYEINNGWLEILAPLLALKLTRTELYHCFNAILTKYIPRNLSNNAQIFHVFRLLILYHDPEICSFLDTKKISTGDFALSWFRSLFAVNCGLKVIHVMWDVYFQQSDPLFIFFLALVILVNTKERLLAMSMEPKETIIDMLVSLPGGLEAADIEDFCSLALYYYMRTPTSFKKNCIPLFINDEFTVNPGCIVSQALCLPVFAEELIYSAKHGSDSDGLESVRFFLVDCRPAEQYNSGHLPTAFHLDANLMLQEPQKFNTAVQALFSTQKQAIAANSVAGGEHLCFMGSGREEEDQYVHMVIASFLQKHRQYVSIAEGGYIALHSLLLTNLSNGLTDHSSKSCLACKKVVENGTSDKDDESFPKSSSIIEKLSLVVKSKSVEMKEKMVELITNPQQQAPERHVSSSDKVGKRYRNMASVFTIDDDHDEGDGDAHLEQEVVSISTWVKKPDVVAAYRCKIKTNEGLFLPCNLLVTETHLYVLRDIPNRRDLAHIASRRALSSIVKITSKKKCPDLITFKYGSVVGDSIEITDVEVFIIPKANEATGVIKQKIMKLID